MGTGSAQVASPAELASAAAAVGAAISAAARELHAPAEGWERLDAAACCAVRRAGAGGGSGDGACIDLESAAPAALFGLARASAARASGGGHDNAAECTHAHGGSHGHAEPTATFVSDYGVRRALTLVQVGEMLLEAVPRSAVAHARLVAGGGALAMTSAALAARRRDGRGARACLRRARQPSATSLSHVATPSAHARALTTRSSRTHRRGPVPRMRQVPARRNGAVVAYQNRARRSTHRGSGGGRRSCHCARGAYARPLAGRARAWSGRARTGRRWCGRASECSRGTQWKA